MPAAAKLKVGALLRCSRKRQDKVVWWLSACRVFSGWTSFVMTFTKDWNTGS